MKVFLSTGAGHNHFFKTHQAPPELCLHLTLISAFSGGQSLLLFVVSALLDPEMISQIEGAKSPGIVFTPTRLHLGTIAMF